MRRVCVDLDIAIGTCYSHDTPISVTGTVNATESYCGIRSGLTYKNVALDGDIVNFSCGHTGVCVGSSTKSLIKNRRLVLHGDQVLKTNGIITGSGDIIATIVATQGICESI